MVEEEAFIFFKEAFKTQILFLFTIYIKTFAKSLLKYLENIGNSKQKVIYFS